MAIGNMRAAAALFVTKELINAVAKYTAPSIPVSVMPKNKEEQNSGRGEAGESIEHLTSI